MGQKDYDKLEDYEKKAFNQGYLYAFGEETHGFGELNHDEEVKFIPDCPDKEKWLIAWHWGCAVGVGE
jgi:hypothetical protein